MPPEPQKHIHPPIFITILLVVAGLIGSFEVYQFYLSPVVGESRDVVRSEVSNWKTYKNNQYGFTVDFLDSWQNYKVTQDLEVYLPTTDLSYHSNLKGYASMFSIQPFSKTDWQKLQNTDQPKPIYLAENEEYIFAYYKAQDTPRDLDIRYHEVNQILSTFKFIK